MSIGRYDRAVLAYSPVDFCTGLLFSEIPVVPDPESDDCTSTALKRAKIKVYFYNFVLFPAILQF